jgi:cytochrome c
MRILLSAAIALFIVATSVRANPAENDAAMLKLATFGGCMACHTIVPVQKRAAGQPPIAPAWRDIAIKYRNDAGASDRLTRLVLAGSDLNVRHWAGKASVDSMPPNAIEITEADARALVNWILILVP